MNPGDKFTLNPTITPTGAYNKTLKYTSSNSDIAYVNPSTGEITAYKAGFAVITATATDGSNVTATCTVYVTPSTPSSVYHSSSSTSVIKVSWDSVYNASGYTLYRKSGSKWKAIKNTTATSYTVKKLKSGTGYQFRVRAYVTISGKKYYSGYTSTGYLATKPGKAKITSIKKAKKTSYPYSITYRATIRWKKVSGATQYKVYYRYAGSSYKYYYGTFKGTKATVSQSISRYSSASKTRTFYVVAEKVYKNRTYTGSYSSGKKYKLK
ncbi:MAG: Ig-like domain-containing protein, partial [Lachnospiraceae bacterium]|nr:Ig-like domain-containing protein [Lachnospiraceae bacterium]